MIRFNATAFLKFDSTVNGNAFVNGPVTVNLAGTSTKASLFSDSLGSTSRDNPTKTDSNGQYFFYIEDGRYDIIINDGNIGTNTIFDELITDGQLDPLVTDFGAVGDGITDDAPAIALAATAAAGRNLVFPNGTYVIGSNVNLSGTTLVFHRGAIIKPDAGVTVSIRYVEAGLYKIYDMTNAGAKVALSGFQGTVDTFPEWWGAKAEDAVGSDNHAALVDALAFGAHLIFNAIYTVNAPLQYNSMMPEGNERYRSSGGINFLLTNSPTSSLMSPIAAGNYIEAKNLTLKIDPLSTFINPSITTILDLVGSRFNRLSGCDFRGQSPLGANFSFTAITLRPDLSTGPVSPNFNTNIFDNSFGNCDTDINIEGASTAPLEILVGTLIRGNHFGQSSFVSKNGANIRISNGVSVIITENNFNGTGAALNNRNINILNNSFFIQSFGNYWDSSFNGEERVTIGAGCTDISFDEVMISSGEVRNNSTTPYNIDEKRWTTFTPTIAGSTVAGSHTYGTQVGRYIRKGNILHFVIEIDIVTKDGAMAGNVEIRGLPFPMKVSTGAGGRTTFTPGYLDKMAPSAGFEHISGILTNGSANIQMFEDNSVLSSNGNFFPVTQLGNRPNFHFNDSYEVL